MAEAIPARAAPWAMVSLALAMLLASLGTSIANVALPTLATTFAAPFAAVQWIVIAYLLASTAGIVGAGRLGDLFGARRLLLGGLGLFAAASIACGAAPNLPVLIAARAAQGVGAAVMTALTVALVRATVAKERTGAAMGVLGTMSAIGTALGPSLGGALVATVGWRGVFLVNVPLAAAAFGLALRHLPRDPAAGVDRERFDVLGTTLLAATLTAAALAMTVGRSSSGGQLLLLVSAAVVGAVAFVLVERRAAAPLLRLDMLRDAGLGPALLTNAAVSAVLMATLVVGPFYLTGALGLSASQAGLVMAVGPVVSAITGVPAGRLVDRVGPTRMAWMGLFGVAAGAMLLAVSGATTFGYLAPIVLMTSSYASFQAANNTAVMTDVAPARRGVVSGLLSLSRNLGLMTGAALLGAVFAAACGTAGVASAAPEVVAGAMRVTFVVAALLVVVGGGAGAWWLRTPRVG